MSQTAFEKSQEGQHAYSLPKDWEELSQYQPDPRYSRKAPLPMPEISEIDLSRHFCDMAKRNIGIDNSFYPLGSCTMKLNPRVNELCASLVEFTSSHPLMPQEYIQGNLQIIFELIEVLCKVCGMDNGSLTPNAGAQGEFTGIKMIAKYHQSRGDAKRTEILIPDDAHGTNPATASMAGFTTIPLKTGINGEVDIEFLKSVVSEKTAGLMLTNPNTLGLFSQNILEIADIVHTAGGLLYYDGANLNAILNIARPGDMGFDVMHINLHKTFSTPHGGGGPGSGPVFCKNFLKHFLPIPRVQRNQHSFEIIWNDSNSIGHIATFHGNFGIYLRAYVYIILHGHAGLRRIAEQAVLNANYLKHHLSSLFNVPYPQSCMHEFVLQADNYLQEGVRALDIAKRILDFGIHPPTIYFPIIVKECMLIEPTESESKATLDRFIETMKTIVQEIKSNPDFVKNAPHTMSVRRLNEVQAVKNPVLKHKTPN